MIYIETLKAKHMNMGFLDVLGELSEVNLTVDEAIRAHSNIMVRMNGTIFVALEENQIIGTISVHILPKFAHKLGFVGQIEDLVVSEDYRNQGIGKLLMYNAVEFAKGQGCYKVVLNHNDLDGRLMDFYEDCGFNYCYDRQMRMDLI